MNFFKAVFDEETTQPESPREVPATLVAPSEDSKPSTSMDSAWSFGGLIKTLASKSESVIETYRRDIEELGSGLRKETSIIRDAASRAVKDLPSSLEAGASVAQESLESMGQAIDDIGLTVWDSTTRIIFGQGNDSSDSESNVSRSVFEQSSSDVKYSRFDAQLLGIQSNLETYCHEPEDKEDYESWKLRSWAVDAARKEEIDSVFQENEIVREAYYEAVPSRVDSETFWRRYFYRLEKFKNAEAARALLVKKAMSSGQGEEEITWDWDEEPDENASARGNDAELHDENSKSKESDGSIELTSGELTEDKGVMAEGKGNTYDNSSESCKESDVSIISNQSVLPDVEDLGWDEIEYSGSNEENKGETAGRRSTDKTSMLKHLSTTEDLSWDVEDEDD